MNFITVAKQSSEQNDYMFIELRENQLKTMGR